MVYTTHSAPCIRVFFVIYKSSGIYKKNIHYVVKTTSIFYQWYEFEIFSEPYIHLFHTRHHKNITDFAYLKSNDNTYDLLSIIDIIKFDWTVQWSYTKSLVLTPSDYRSAFPWSNYNRCSFYTPKSWQTSLTSSEFSPIYTLFEILFHSIVQIRNTPITRWS